MGENNFNKQWTDEEIATMKKMLDNGHTIEEISKKLGRTYKSVQMKLYKLGFKSNDIVKPQWTKDEIITLRKMLKNECTVFEIANKLGRSKKAVKKKISKLGWSDVVQKEVPAAFDKSNVFCPFFVSMWNKCKISCEGLAKADRITLLFLDRNSWEEHLTKFCQTKNYVNCPLSKSLNEKYSE